MPSSADIVHSWAANLAPASPPVKAAGDGRFVSNTVLDFLGDAENRAPSAEAWRMRHHAFAA